MNQFANLHNLFLGLYKQLLDNYTYKNITFYIYIYRERERERERER